RRDQFLSVQFSRDGRLQHRRRSSGRADAETAGARAGAEPGAAAAPSAIDRSRRVASDRLPGALSDFRRRLFIFALRRDPRAAASLLSRGPVSTAGFDLLDVT